MTWSHSAGVIFRTVLSTVMPALLIRISRCPCRSRTSPMTRAQSSLEPMLPWWMLTPWSAYLSANCSAWSCPLAKPAATLMPRFISRSQMASPMPRVPPVTSATCPIMSAMMYLRSVPSRPRQPNTYSPGAPAMAGCCLLPRRVDDASDMPAAGQHVADVTAHQPTGLIGPVPGHDVIVDGADHVGVVLHRGQRQILADQLELAPG